MVLTLRVAIKTLTRMHYDNWDVIHHGHLENSLYIERGHFLEAMNALRKLRFSDQAERNEAWRLLTAIPVFRINAKERAPDHTVFMNITYTEFSVKLNTLIATLDFKDVENPESGFEFHSSFARNYKVFLNLKHKLVRFVTDVDADRKAYLGIYTRASFEKYYGIEWKVVQDMLPENEPFEEFIN